MKPILFLLTFFMLIACKKDENKELILNEDTAISFGISFIFTDKDGNDLVKIDSIGKGIPVFYENEIPDSYTIFPEGDLCYMYGYNQLRQNVTTNNHYLQVQFPAKARTTHNSMRLKFNGISSNIDYDYRMEIMQVWDIVTTLPVLTSVRFNGHEFFSRTDGKPYPRDIIFIVEDNKITIKP